ncbi:hypothetical protein GALL_404350 [mine drainage metagenome]|uniref:Uncharacterized protein n=1 Tax=mine drainage metagenome TaxID=410659 RepID=A0A1J5QPI7_9ZZZZ
MLPRWQIHVCQTDLDLAADLVVANGGQVVVIRIKVFQLVGQVIDAGDCAGLVEGADLGQRVRVVRTQGLERQAEGLNRAFEALEQVGSHQRLQAFFAVRLPEFSFAACHLRVVHLFVLLEPTRQDVADRGVHSELEQGELLEDLVETHHVGSLRERTVERQGFAAFGELADVLGIVEGLDVLARARDGDAIEQFEEVEVQRVQDGPRCALFWWKLCPCVEAGLRTTEDVLYRLAGA